MEQALKLSLVSVLVFLAIGCSAPIDASEHLGTVASPARPVLAVQFKSPEKDRADAEAAVRSWNDVCGQVLVLSDDPQERTMTLDENAADYGDPNYMAETIDHRTILYRNTYTLRHELGHILGLEHKATGVMRADAPDDPITFADCPR